jgi:hypothetical protein
VGQIGKILGLHVVGIAGGEAKCDNVINTLEFDICTDCKANGFSAELKATVPDGIDIYFENVGGDVFDAFFHCLTPRRTSRFAALSRITTPPRCQTVRTG